jgi:DnaJ homolog subfamily A member 2
VTGDIVFVLQLKDHPKFKRKYDDLYIKHTISLTEALCGFQFVLTHLDGRQLLIKSDPGEVIKPGMTPFWMCSFFGLFSFDLYCPINPMHFVLNNMLIQCFVWTGQYKAINDEGMPQHGRPFTKGRLFVEFNVEFPEPGTLTPAQCQSIEKILPPKPGRKLSDKELDQCEETTLHDINMEEEMRRKQQQRQQEAYDEDEEEEGGPRVQCAQQ